MKSASSFVSNCSNVLTFPPQFHRNFVLVQKPLIKTSCQFAHLERHGLIDRGYPTVALIRVFMTRTHTLRQQAQQRRRAWEVDTSGHWYVFVRRLRYGGTWPDLYPDLGLAMCRSQNQSPHSVDSVHNAIGSGRWKLSSRGLQIRTRCIMNSRFFS